MSLTLIINLFFILFLSISVTIIYRITSQSIRERTDIENITELETLHSYLSNYISRLETTVVHLSEVESIKSFIINRDPGTKLATERLFSTLVKHSTKPLLPTIDHIRLFDLNGLELLRVNLQPDGATSIVPDNSLQDKSDRYYFKELKEILNSEIYLSPIDLNIENGKLEVPFKSVIRAGNKIFHKGKLVGYLLINANFTPLASQLEQVKSQKGMDWFVTNSDGYYLINRDEDKEFTFMLPGKSHIGLFSDYPDIWNKFQNKFNSIQEYEEGIFYIKRLTIGGTTTSINSKGWIIGTNLTKGELNEKNILLNRGILIGYLLLTPLLIFTGVFLGRSITQNRYYIEELKSCSIHDKLTGLLNYQGALEKADILTKLSSRMDKNLFSVFIDLNDLKKINDTYGHKSGDKLITTMSSIISKEVRDTDAAGRLGGDEFILLLFDLHKDDIVKIMGRIESNFAIEGKKIFGSKTRFSWGHSRWKGERDDIESFISRADSNMYKMKRQFKR